MPVTDFTGLNQVEGAADEREKVDGAEDDFHAVGHFLLRDFLRGRRGGRENETAVRVDFAPRLKGGECEIGFADAYRMHPDRAVERFQARLFLFGENGEAFRIRAFDSRTADQLDEQSRQEKQERQRKLTSTPPIIMNRRCQAGLARNSQGCTGCFICSVSMLSSIMPAILT